MGSTWGPPGSCRPQMGPMLAPWTLLSGTVTCMPGLTLERWYVQTCWKKTVSVPDMRLPMEHISYGVLQGSLLGRIVGGGGLEAGRVGQALWLDGTGQRVDFGSHSDQCFHNPDVCGEGVTFAMSVKIRAGPSVIFGSGGRLDSSNGYLLMIEAKPTLLAVVKWSGGYEYHKVPNVADMINRWVHITFAWKKEERISLFINGCDVLPSGNQVYRINRRRGFMRWTKFFIGYPVDGVRGDAADMALDEFYVWYRKISALNAWYIFAAGSRIWYWTTLTMNSLKLDQNGGHFEDNTFICQFLKDKVWISIPIFLKFV